MHAEEEVSGLVTVPFMLFFVGDYIVVYRII
jgi:hypothetical protein